MLRWAVASTLAVGQRGETKSDAGLKAQGMSQAVQSESLSAHHSWIVDESRRAGGYLQLGNPDSGPW